MSVYSTLTPMTLVRQFAAPDDDLLLTLDALRHVLDLGELADRLRVVDGQAAGVPPPCRTPPAVALPGKIVIMLVPAPRI